MKQLEKERKPKIEDDSPEAIYGKTAKGMVIVKETPEERDKRNMEEAMKKRRLHHK